MESIHPIYKKLVLLQLSSVLEYREKTANSFCFCRGGPSGSVPKIGTSTLCSICFLKWKILKLRTPLVHPQAFCIVESPAQVESNLGFHYDPGAWTLSWQSQGYVWQSQSACDSHGYLVRHCGCWDLTQGGHLLPVGYKEMAAMADWELWG